MRPTFYLLTFLIFLFSCSPSKKEANQVDNIEIGMTVGKVIENLKIETSDLSIIQEPPLIYRGINATLDDSTEIGISFERTPANHNDLSKEKALETIKKLKINGFAWREKEGNGGIKGNIPVFWVE